MIEKFVRDGVLAFLPAMGTIQDISPRAITFTHSGISPNRKNSSKAVYYNSTATSLSTINNPILNADFANGITIAATARFDANSGTYIFDIGGAIYLRVDKTTGKTSFVVDGGAPSSYTTSDQTGKFYTVIGTFNTSTNKLYTYINGVCEVNGVSKTKYNIDLLTRKVAIGCAQDGSGSLIGTVGAVLVGGFFLQPRDVGILHRELINLTNSNVQFKRNDTYNFISYQSVRQSIIDDGGEVGRYLGDSPFRFGDTVMRAKISLDSHLGQVVKVIECTVGGTMLIDQANSSWTAYLKKSGETAYTKQDLTTAGITTGTDLTTFTMAAGDKMIFSSMMGDFLITR